MTYTDKAVAGMLGSLSQPRIKAFDGGNFRLIGKARDIPAMMAAVAASRNSYNQWQEEQANKAHSQSTQITSRRNGPQNYSANSETGECPVCSETFSIPSDVNPEECSCPRCGFCYEDRS
jgi:hypothetical protein